jgi:hypothetical protein
MYEREFITAFDWEHTGEGLQAFHFYGLGRPDDPRYRERVVRFAGFYNGDDPVARNYDPEHRVIRSLHNGSRGPKMTPATEQDWGGLPVRGEPERLTRYSTASRVVGDHPLNLLSTTLGVNAYVLTGERKYRDWVLEYAGAWRDRILSNGGNIPTRIGLDGTIGGEADGKWYDGVFGWNFWPEESGRNYFMRGPRVAMGNGLLLTGDPGWIEPLRQQITNLHAVRRVENGRISNSYVDFGGFQPGGREFGSLRARTFPIFLEELLRDLWGRAKHLASNQLDLFSPLPSSIFRVHLRAFTVLPPPQTRAGTLHRQKPA